MILIGTSKRAVEIRGELRQALGMTAAFDEIAEDVRELAKAIKRRQAYWLIRRAAVVLADIGETDAAAVLEEAASRNEPMGDGVEFSPKRRTKTEVLLGVGR